MHWTKSFKTWIVKLYEQAAQQQAQENPEAAQGGADDVVDADFEEVDGDDK